jgi:hypothetical protein
MAATRMALWVSRSLLASCVALLGACAGPGDDGSGGGVSASSSGASRPATSSSGASGSSGSGAEPPISGASSSGGTPPGSSSSGSGSSSSAAPTGDDSGAGSTQLSSGDAAAGNDDAAPPSGSSGGPSASCFAAGGGTDFTSDGPLVATSADVPSVSCTIFRPTVLGSGGCLNPVIVWGNGTLNSPSSYTALFNHFASQGFIVAAADTSNSGSGMEMLACLTYILGQNTMSGSPLQGHVDTGHIASSGYSQGGAGCLAAGEDPRFTTVLAVSPYVVISLGSYDPSTYAKAQTHPLFMISGSADSVATPNNNQQPIFDTAPVPIFWGTHAGSTHFEVLGGGGAYAGPMTAWFRWKLMGDTTAESWFEKPPCTLCSTAGWTVQTNSKWQ